MIPLLAMSEGDETVTLDALLALNIPVLGVLTCRDPLAAMTCHRDTHSHAPLPVSTALPALGGLARVASLSRWQDVRHPEGD